MSWKTLRQLKGKSVQSYTQEFRKRALILGISLDPPKTLLEYIGGLHSYLRHTILMFNPTSIYEVSVQATHLEARGKIVNPEIGGSSKPTASKNKENKKQKWKERKANVVQKDKPSSLTARRMDMMMHILHKPYFFLTNTIGDRHGDVLGLMNPFLSSSCTCFLISAFSKADNLYIPMLGNGASCCK